MLALNDVLIDWWIFIVVRSTAGLGEQATAGVYFFVQGGVEKFSSMFLEIFMIYCLRD